MADEDVEVRDLTDAEKEAAVHATKGQVKGKLAGRAMDDEEYKDTMSERNREPVDLTVDSEPDREREWREKNIAYDPVIHEVTKPPNKQIDAAEWDDLRSLPKPPSAAFESGKGVKVYVCIQHPSMWVFDGDTVVGRFEDGYLATSDTRVQEVLERPNQRYVKKLDMRKVRG